MTNMGGWLPDSHYKQNKKKKARDSKKLLVRNKKKKKKMKKRKTPYVETLLLKYVWKDEANKRVSE